MKIQLANRTYHQTNEGCCIECSFWHLKQLNLWEVQGGCQFYFKCHNPFKKQLFNDKIFKL